MARIQVLHHVRRLLRVVDRELLLGGAPVGNLAARLQRHTGVAAKFEGGVDHVVGLRKGLVHAARVQAAGEAQVVAQLGVNHRGAGVEGGFHVDHRRQQLPLDLQVLQRVFGLGAGVGHDGHHRFALPVRALHRQRVLRGRFHVGQVAQGGDPRLANFGQHGAVCHQQHAGHAARKVSLDAGDAAVRHWAAPVHHMGHARQLDVVDVTALALHQAARAGALRAVADVARVLRQVVQGGVLGVDHGAHAAASWWRWANTSHTASTMAW